MPVNDNVDLDEIAKFEKLASRWWDPNSEFKPLHDINPLRAGWIDQHADVKGKNVLDVGCGGQTAHGRPGSEDSRDPRAPAHSRV